MVKVNITYKEIDQHHVPPHIMPEKNIIITVTSHYSRGSVVWGMQVIKLLQFIPLTTKKEVECLLGLFRIWRPPRDITLAHLPGSIKGCQF